MHRGFDDVGRALNRRRRNGTGGSNLQRAGNQPSGSASLSRVLRAECSVGVLPCFERGTRTQRFPGEAGYRNACCTGKHPLLAYALVFKGRKASGIESRISNELRIFTLGCCVPKIPEPGFYSESLHVDVVLSAAPPKPGSRCRTGGGRHRLWVSRSSGSEVDFNEEIRPILNEIA